MTANVLTVPVNDAHMSNYILLKEVNKMPSPAFHSAYHQLIRGVLKLMVDLIGYTYAIVLKP